MFKVAIVTDSIACLTKEQVEQYGIGIIPINFYAMGKLYKDWVDVNPSEAYELFLKDPDSFKTSAASPEECLQVFKAAAEMAESIFCVTLSTHLSMMYNAALEAKELALTELPKTTIEVMDSYTATASEGMVALAAARAATNGADMAEVIHTAETIRGKVHAYLLLDTIKHVYRSGRIPKIASQIGSALNIKPLLSVADVVHFSRVVRSRKQGLSLILQMVRDNTGKSPINAAVMHAYAPEEAQRLKELLAAEFNCTELWLTEFSPIMGYACGTGTVGVAYYVDE